MRDAACGLLGLEHDTLTALLGQTHSFDSFFPECLATGIREGGLLCLTLQDSFQVQAVRLGRHLRRRVLRLAPDPGN